jgi:YesN/AraC family two-component response regulator
MKVIPFTIPVTQQNSIVVQEDILPHFYNHLHRHPEIQITWIIKGEGTLIAGNYMQHFKAGEVYIIGANQPHIFKSDNSYFDKKKKKNIHSLTLFFSDTFHLAPLFDLPEMKNIKKLIRKTLNSLKLPANHQREIIAHLLNIKDSREANRLINFINLLNVLSNIKNFRTLSTETNTSVFTDTEGRRMNEIYQYTMEHYIDNITLSEIASVAHLTPQAFCRYFKRRTGRSYITFLNEVRSGEAIKLLKENNYESIGKIAYSSGFNNITSFNRVFKQITGKSPREYSKEFINNVDGKN